MTIGASLAEYETSRSGNQGKRLATFRGERIFCIPTVELDTWEPQYTVNYQNKWPGTSGFLAPYIHEYKVVWAFPGRPTFSRVTCWYKTPKWRIPDTGQPVRGTLISRTGGRMTKLLVEPVIADGQSAVRIIEGPSLVAADKSKGIYFKVTKGDNKTMIASPQWEIRALAITWDPTTVEELVGCINADSIFFGHGPAGTIMFGGAEAEAPLNPEGEDGAFWSVRLAFLQNRLGWNTSVESAKFENIPVKKEVYDDADPAVATGRFRDVLTEKITTTPEARVVGATADFSIFEQMLTG